MSANTRKQVTTVVIAFATTGIVSETNFTGSYAEQRDEVSAFVTSQEVDGGLMTMTRHIWHADANEFNEKLEILREDVQRYTC